MLSIGEILKRERKNKGLTLEQIEKTTRIRYKNLLAIEKSDWDSFHSKTYILGIIKSYGKYLGLDEEKLAAFFRREYEQKEDIHFKSKVSKKQLTPRAKRIFLISLGILISLFVFYFGYQLKIYSSPPKITILKPQTTEFRNIDKVELVGQVEKESIVTVNAERVYQNDQQIFSTFIPLTKQKNEVIIEVTDANGKKTVVRKVFDKK
jgi:cytoskeletal protein RodZ